MFFASLRPYALLGCLVALAGGCSAAGIEKSEPTNLDDGSGGSTSTLIDATIDFEGPAEIEVAPGETRELTVVTSPPASYEMYFALLDAPSDASLDASHVFTAGDGVSTLKLRAPSTPATFAVRAWIKDGPSTELTVSVNKQGVGTLQVIPVYDGQREVTEWVASVISGTTCQALAGQLPGEPSGALVAVSEAPEAPVVQSVPVGPKLAVTVRAGHYAWGCDDAGDIAAGATTKVKIHVVDVPPALDETHLAVSLAYTPEPAGYAALLDNARGDFIEGFVPPYETEPEALLNAMSALAIDPAAFAQSREALGWDALAAAHFASLPVSLTGRMNGWISAGLAASPPELTGTLTALDGVSGKALLLTGAIAGAEADAVGAPAAHIVSWTSAPNDNVFLKGSLYWLPSRFVGDACRAGAEAELGPIESMVDALTAEAQCTALAYNLGGFPGCDAGCLTDLCRAAVDMRWQSALDASAWAGTVGTIDIGASGKLQVDDTASPVAFTGTWLGKVSDGKITATVEGLVTGTLPPPEAPSPTTLPRRPPQ
ncbi:MAG: hypothetical protein R3F14_12305 [Polyangiaceae bacterium]